MATHKMFIRLLQCTRGSTRRPFPKAVVRRDGNSFAVDRYYLNWEGDALLYHSTLHFTQLVHAKAAAIRQARLVHVLSANLMLEVQDAAA